MVSDGTTSCRTGGTEPEMTPQQRARRRGGAALTAALVSAGAVVFADTSHAASAAGVTICHAAGGSGRWVVLTADAHAVTSKGHAAHQDGRDVIPPIEYVPEGSTTTVRFPGLNWTDNWATSANGAAEEEVVPTDCPGEGPPDRPRSDGPRSEGSKPDGPKSEGSKPDGPKFEGSKPGKADPPPKGKAHRTSFGAAAGTAPSAEATPSGPAIVGGGLALLLAGGATAAGVRLRARP